MPARTSTDHQIQCSANVARFFPSLLNEVTTTSTLLLFEDSSVSPVLEVTEHLGIVFGHLNCLVLGSSPLSAARKNPDVPQSSFLCIYVNKPSLGPDSDVNDRIKSVPVPELASEMAIVTVVKDS